MLFLGFDFSTQGATAIVVDASPTSSSSPAAENPDEAKSANSSSTSSPLAVVASAVINFDKDLPQFKTENGVHKHENNAVTAPSLMFAAALEAVLDRLTKESPSLKLSSITALSGSGQQHGSVYWRKGSGKLLEDLKFPLEAHLKDAFAISEGPIWMDSSTTKQCGELENALGGPQKVADISGSRAYERFTGNQIAKLSAENSELFANDVERISLVSSMLPSILTGKYAPIDNSDGSGMNLMDIRTHKWSQTLLDATCPNLAELLGEPALAHELLGKIHPSFVDRFGFSPECDVIAFSGDNPCSLAGLMISEPGDICVSLGTSDTLLGVTTDPQPSIEGHVLCHPVRPDAYFAMLCYKNGSLAREAIRNSAADSSWDKFDKALSSTPSGNDGKCGLYFFEEEILPPGRGVFRFDADDTQVDSFDNAANDVRAVVESQFLNMKRRSQRIGISSPRRIIATGGASKNSSILQVLSDVFNVSVYTSTVGSNSAAYGAALRAAHGRVIEERGKFVKFREALCHLLQLDSFPEFTAKVVEPNAENFKVYEALNVRADRLERQALSGRGDAAD